MTHLYAFDTTGKPFLIDLYPEESISLTFRFTDVQKFDTKGSFSKEFRVPASDTNSLFFGKLFNANETGFDFRRKVDAYLSVDTLPVSTGHIQMRKVYTIGDTFSEYELTFYAETPDLATVIGDKKLRDIDALDALDHEIDFDEVTDTPADRGFFLLDRGQRWSQEGQPGTRPVLNANFPPFPPDLSPAVRARYLFDNIISEAGFTWEGWQGNTTLADRLDQYYVPFVINRFIQHEGNPQDEFFRLGLDADVTGINQEFFFPSFQEVYDTGNNVSGSIFTAPYTGQFQFRLWAKATRDITAIFSQQWIQQQLMRNGQLLVSAGVSTLQVSQQTITTSYLSDPILLNQGDTVQYRIKKSSSLVYDLKGTSDYDIQSGTGWEIADASFPYSGQDMVYKRNAPDYKQIDFIRDIVKAHNCVVIPDRNEQGKLFIEPITTFIGTGASLDWTDKMDVSKDVTLMPTTDYQSRNLLFTYKAGGEFNSQFYLKDAGRVYGDYKVEGYTVNPSERPNDFAQGDNKIELGMQSTPCSAIPGTNIIIPKFTSESGEFVVPGVRLLFNSGTADIILYDDVTAAAPVNATVFLLNHYENTFPDIADEDLNFAPEDPLYIGPVQTYNNLFNRYFRAYLNEIYDASARVMIAYFKLNIGDITQFTFADKIFIRDSYWRILEINGYVMGADDVTQVTLMKIVNPALDCPFIPATVTTAGIITFTDADGDPSVGSEECCTRFGYSWEAGRCYAIRPASNPISLSVQGTLGIGNSANGKNPPATGNIIVSPGSDIALDITESLIAGMGNKITEGNSGVVVVGDGNAVLKSIGAGGAVFGKNAIVEHPGIHLGGNWYDGDREAAQGRAQFGIIMLAGQGDFVDNTTEIPLHIEGIVGKNIDLLDDSMWMAQINVIMQQMSGTSVIGEQYAMFTVRLSKDAGNAKAGTPHRIYADGNIGGNPNLEVDVATISGEHIISVRVQGGSHPFNDVHISAALLYTQVTTGLYL
jgi:hypothetical protein